MLSNEPEFRDRLKKPKSLVQNCETGNRRVDIAEFIAWIKTGLRGRLRYTTRPRHAAATKAWPNYVPIARQANW